MTGVTASWYELCMDTTGGETLGRFWAAATGLRFEPDQEDGNVVGDVAGQVIAMCRVPEEKTVKHRVHLDVHCRSVDDLVALGASVVAPAEETGEPFTVLRDPEGGEFCAFVREDPPDYRLYQLVVDAVDAERSARWWGEVLGGRVGPSDAPGWWRLYDVPTLPFEELLFQQVPEPKTVKNRVHWDVHGRVEELEAQGATLLRRRDDEISWDVMADPEGNEFCVFTPQG